MSAIRTYRVMKPLGMLPPMRVMSLIADGSGLDLDIPQKCAGIAFTLHIHEHGGGTANYIINDGKTLTLKGNQDESIDNIQIERIRVSNETNVDIIIGWLPLSELKLYGALRID